ncbi:MAG: AI-2E family transporter [Acidobacteria bacterium]|nr:AI-2E family transporter [Acidobacteriota bacterium]
MATPQPKVSVLIQLAAFVVVVAGLKAAQDIVLMILAAGFIAVAVAPPIFLLQRKGVPFLFALALVMAAVIGIFGTMAGVVGASVNDFTEQLPVYQTRVRDGIDQLTSLLSNYNLQLALEKEARDLLDPGQVMSLAAGLFAGLGGLLANSFLIFIMVIFLLLEASTFPTKLQAAFHDRGKAMGRFKQLGASVNHYLAIKTWVSLVTGLIAGLLCWAIGVDFALLWGLLAFLLNYVPNIGSVIAAVPPVLLALVQLGSGAAFAVLVGYVLINNILGNFVEPRFMGEGLGLSAFAVLLSLVFWGWVLGPVGMLLSIPLTMAVKIAMEEHPDTRWLALMLGSGAEAEVELARQRDLSSADRESTLRAGPPS